MLHPWAHTHHPYLRRNEVMYKMHKIQTCTPYSCAAFSPAIRSFAFISHKRRTCASDLTGLTRILHTRPTYIHPHSAASPAAAETRNSFTRESQMSNYKVKTYSGGKRNPFAVAAAAVVPQVEYNKRKSPFIPTIIPSGIFLFGRAKRT